jgi:hypothetical protein
MHWRVGHGQNLRPAAWSWLAGVSGRSFCHKKRLTGQHHWGGPSDPKGYEDIGPDAPHFCIPQEAACLANGTIPPAMTMVWLTLQLNMSVAVTSNTTVQVFRDLDVF